MARTLIFFSLFVPLAFSLIAPQLAGAAPGSGATGITLLGVPLNCDPALAPSKNGCGIIHFMLFLRGLVGTLTKIVIPLAAAVIVAGGIVIMTAGGSQERVGKGKAIITAAVWGVAIALGSWLIINSIYLALTGRGAEEKIQEIQEQQ